MRTFSNKITTQNQWSTVHKSNKRYHPLQLITWLMRRDSATCQFLLMTGRLVKPHSFNLLGKQIITEPRVLKSIWLKMVDVMEVWVFWGINMGIVKCVEMIIYVVKKHWLNLDLLVEQEKPLYSQSKVMPLLWYLIKNNKLWRSRKCLINLNNKVLNLWKVKNSIHSSRFKLKYQKVVKIRKLIIYQSIALSWRIK